MRALGCMVVRDECDIIELAVRHNLALLDGIAIIDHGSTDGTSEILAALAAEGLPVFVTPDRNPKFRQKAMINALVRNAIWMSAADWIFAIDADEFIVARDRADLERTLASLPRDRPTILEWPTYVPSFDPDIPLSSRLLRARRVIDPGHAHKKLAVPRAVLTAPGVEFDTGQHKLESIGAGTPLPLGQPVERDRLSLAHVPIRSAAQFAVKAVSGWLSIVAQERRRPAFSHQWRDAFDAIVAGQPVDGAMLTAFAVNYGVQRPGWREGSGLLEDAPPFLLAGEVRYTALARPLGLVDLLKLAERLLTVPR